MIISFRLLCHKCAPQITSCRQLLIQSHWHWFTTFTS